MIAALMAGFDDVITLPLYLPLLQARVLAHRRLVRSVRKNAVKKVKKKLHNKREKAIARTLEGAGALVEAQVSEALEAPPAADGLPPDVTPPLPAGDVLETFAESLVENVVEEMAEEFLGTLTDDLETVLNIPAGGVEVVEDEAQLTVGALRLDLRSYRFYVGEEEVELTPKEFKLLYYLMRHVGVACTRDQILDEVWGIDFDTGTNMVDVYMHFLRRKLHAHGLREMLQTVRGRGYRLVLPEDVPAS